MFLSSSTIVGFLRLYRHFVLSKLYNEPEKIRERLSLVDVSFKYEDYKYTSSQWAKLEAAMYAQISHGFPKFGDKSIVKFDTEPDKAGMKPIVAKAAIK